MTLDAATYVYVAYLDRGREIENDILCRRCYEELARDGAYDPERNQMGQSIRIIPWTGELRCSGCEERQRAEERAGEQSTLSGHPDAWAGGFARNH